VNILSFTLVYPNPAESGLGLFVRARLQQMGRNAAIKVIAPVPLLDYLHPTQKLRPRSAIPLHRPDGQLDVYHPRWLYPPLGTPLNVCCLFARVFPLAARIRRDFPFQLIDAHFGYPEGVVAALLAAAFRCPFAVTLRGNEIKFAQYRFRRPLIRWALRRAARVITVSEELRQFAIGLGADPAKVKTIPNGIDPDIFAPRERAACRRKFGIPEGTAAIACAGELVERKGHHLVVRALQSIVNQGIDAHVWIAGTAGRDGPGYEHVIRRLASELGLTGRVHLLGFVQRAELPDLLSAADVFCLPSTLEGWPNVVHEASACGAPVVATAVGGVPEMLPSQQYGLVVPVGDQAALDSALLQALRKLWDRDAISAWGRSRSWKTVAEEALQILVTAHAV
jgi:teichuronic acid biosynthesis glycosyltransferase TuaC